MRSAGHSTGCGAAPVRWAAPRRTTVLVVAGIIVSLLAGALLDGVAAQGPGPYPGHRPFRRGDANVDGGVNLGDAIAILASLFVPGVGAIPCRDAGDVNDDERLDVADPVTLLAYLFASGPNLPEPFMECGHDPTVSIALECEAYPPCDAITDADLAAHLMRRLGYGPTPDGLAFIEAVGAEVYIEQQLFPELIDEGDNFLLNTFLAGLEPQSDLLSLVMVQVVRALYSERQLQEALTDFWENHFNTYLPAVQNLLRVIQVGGVPIYTPEEALAEAVRWEWEENQTLRGGALGGFGDLLAASATGRTMLIYLDGIFNTLDAPNENYARELLELHTMGVDNGYTQVDVEQVARCFTGWTICKVAPGNEGDPFAPCLPFNDPNAVWAFHFFPPNHDYGPKTIFEGTSYQLDIPPRPAGSPDGILDGFQVLDHLVMLPQTAEFVSTKLIRKLVADEPPPELVAQCLVTWLNSGGNLREVVSTILFSEEFLLQTHRWGKVETPFEYLVSCLRSVGMISSGFPVIAGLLAPTNGLVGLNHIPFFFPTPDGQPESGFDWMGSSTLLQRINFAVLAPAVNDDPLFDPLGMMEEAGVPFGDVEAVAEFWLQTTYQHSHTMAERALVIDYLSRNDEGIPAPLDPAAPDYEARIRALVGYILSAPQAQKQ
ncbi:MAG: DUF1800 family protein [Planctomycetota bacterium]